MIQLLAFKNVTVTYWREGSSFISLWKDASDTFIRLGKVEVLLTGASTPS